jgi:hypothetical protein
MPDDTIHQRLASVRALTRLYYAGVLLSASAATLGAIADHDLAVPTDLDFQRAISEGQRKPGAPETKHTLGKMYLKSFLNDLTPPGLGAAI